MTIYNDCHGELYMLNCGTNQPIIITLWTRGLFNLYNTQLQRIPLSASVRGSYPRTAHAHVAHLSTRVTGAHRSAHWCRRRHAGEPPRARVRNMVGRGWLARSDSWHGQRGTAGRLRRARFLLFLRRFAAFNSAALSAFYSRIS